MVMTLVEDRDRWVALVGAARLGDANAWPALIDRFEDIGTCRRTARVCSTVVPASQRQALRVMTQTKPDPVWPEASTSRSSVSSVSR